LQNKIFAFIPVLLVVASCEKVPVLEARVEGEGIVALTEYETHGTWPQYWSAEDDWHSLFLAARARPDRLYLFVRTDNEPAQALPAVWTSAEKRPVLLGITTECVYDVQYFDNPGNSFLNNFLQPEYPETYPHSPPTEAPGLSAILTVEDCVGPTINVSIAVLDESKAPARTHSLTIRIVPVDWYYNPLFP
jgi:hypothetical protein